MVGIVGFTKQRIKYCDRCSSLGPALINIGLFPSTPIHPNFVFDLNLLDHVSTLFLYVTPNIEAWSYQLADVLERKGYLGFQKVGSGLFHVMCI